MTPFATLGALVRRSLLPVLALASATAAQAQAVQWSTGQVLIDFDPSTFVFTSDTVYSGSMGVSPSYSLLGQGVELNFGGQAGALASSYQNFSSDMRYAPFSAFIGFTAEAGYAITGYTITYTGGYSVESPAGVSLIGHAGPLLSASSGSDSFVFTDVQTGSVAPLITGELSAYADVTYIEIFDGYQEVYSHDEQVLDYCEPDNPDVCYYHTEPVYTYEPIYHYESDLGEGQIYLSTITVQANVVAVPEPGMAALLLGGLPLLAWRLRRRA